MVTGSGTYCAAADCSREPSVTVEVVAVDGRDLPEPLPLRICLPCQAYYGLPSGRGR